MTKVTVAIIRGGTLKEEESNFPASALKKVVFPDPGAPRTSVILDEQQEERNYCCCLI
jgi:hypothetical protein